MRTEYFNEQQIWWVALVSNTQDNGEIEDLERMKEKKSIPLRLEMDGLGYCNSREIWELPWSFELKRVISWWHWVEVSEPKTESNELDCLVIVEVVWYTCAFDCEDLNLNLYPSRYPCNL